MRTISQVKRFLMAWTLLLYCDALMQMKGFDSLHSRVRSARTQEVADIRNSPGELSHLIDLACVLYFKQVFCLQRSAALTLLLRYFGYPARLVLGVQLVPYQSHAWVHLDGVVVNDKQYVVARFQVLDQC